LIVYIKYKPPTGKNELTRRGGGMDNKKGVSFVGYYVIVIKNFFIYDKNKKGCSYV
jgi:hypothetical protein